MARGAGSAPRTRRRRPRRCRTWRAAPPRAPGSGPRRCWPAGPRPSPLRPASARAVQHLKLVCGQHLRAPCSTLNWSRRSQHNSVMMQGQAWPRLPAMTTARPSDTVATHASSTEQPLVRTQDSGRYALRLAPQSMCRAWRPPSISSGRRPTLSTSSKETHVPITIVPPTCTQARLLPDQCSTTRTMACYGPLNQTRFLSACMVSKCCNTGSRMKSRICLSVRLPTASTVKIIYGSAAALGQPPDPAHWTGADAGEGHGRIWGAQPRRRAAPPAGWSPAW